MTEDIEICSMPRVTFAKVLNLFRRLLHHTLWDFYSGEWKVITNLTTAQDLDELMTMIIMMAKIIVNENIVQYPADMNISQGWNMSRAQYLRLYRCHVWVGRCHKWKTCLFEIFCFHLLHSFRRIVLNYCRYSILYVKITNSLNANFCTEATCKRTDGFPLFDSIYIRQHLPFLFSSAFFWNALESRTCAVQ